MAKTVYSKHKTAILKWRASNPDRYKAANRKQKERAYNWNKAKHLFLNILLDFHGKS
jgi:hypothetical protein